LSGTIHVLISFQGFDLALVIMRSAKIWHDFRGFVFSGLKVTPSYAICRSHRDLP